MMFNCFMYHVCVCFGGAVVVVVVCFRGGGGAAFFLLLFIVCELVLEINVNNLINAPQ